MHLEPSADAFHHPGVDATMARLFEGVPGVDREMPRPHRVAVRVGESLGQRKLDVRQVRGWNAFRLAEGARQRRKGELWFVQAHMSPTYSNQRIDSQRRAGRHRFLPKHEGTFVKRECVGESPFLFERVAEVLDGDRHLEHIAGGSRLVDGERSSKLLLGLGEVPYLRE